MISIKSPSVMHKEVDVVSCSKSDFGGLWKYFARIMSQRRRLKRRHSEALFKQTNWQRVRVHRISCFFRFPSHYERRGIALPTLRATPNLVELDRSGNCRAYFSCRMFFRNTSCWAVFVVLKESLQMRRHFSDQQPTGGVQPIGCSQWVFPGRCSPCESLGKNTN